MRLKLGRPDLASHADLFDVPAHSPGGGPSVTFLGVSTLLLDDGDSALLTDGFFSRPGMARVLLGRIAPDRARVDDCLARAGISRLEAVLPVHSHYDHALDSAYVAERTGALLVGGASTANLGRGHGLHEERIRIATPGEPIGLGAWSVTLVASTHCPPDRYPGVIEEPVTPPAKVRRWRCGEAWSMLVRHQGGRSALVQGSAGFVAGALDGTPCDVAYLGVGQLGVQPDSYLHDYWQHTVRAVGARRVVLTHWDDFFAPLDRPLRALPYAGDDLDRTLAVLLALARADDVTLSMPTVWRREDPWA
ncbi:MBL fold metallo-hydrolase [Nocardioides terrisoli]|uniref:MBL fold metallo-hydrolase n=1 Tax=Nocardioides terrisoli TaxID=3388267 RepID=UPI00287B8C92|nr:MBL fold metallo-hydrolase [Nocardioides marmorisolisilvae]